MFHSLPVPGQPAQWVGLAVLLLTFLPGAARAQGTLRGMVESTDRQPLPGVNVVVQTLQRGTVTGEGGRYVLDDLPAGTHVVEYRYVGFATETRTVALASGQARTLDVRLHPVTIETEEVTVTAEGEAATVLNRAARSVSVLEPKALDAVRGQTLGETLEQLPGVTALTTGPSISKPVVRGLHSTRVVVLNAGVPQEGQQWGGEHAPEIDPFAPARVEVVKGAAGVEYGVGAIGGVIRVEPRELPDRPGFGGRAAFNGFSNSLQGAASLLLEGSPEALPGFGMRVQGSLRKAGDAHTPDYVIGNSAFEERDLSVALGYHTPRLGVEGYYSRFSTDLGIFTGSHVNTIEGLENALAMGRPAVDYTFSYGIDAPKQSITHDLVTLKGHYDLAGGDALEVQYGLQRNHRQEFDAHRRGGEPLDQPAYDLTLITHTLEAKLRQQPRGNFFGVVGVSGMNQGNTNAQAGYLIPNFRALTGSAFARGTWVRGPLTLEGGLRFDYRWMRAHPRASGDRGAFVTREHRYANLGGVLGAIWQFDPAWSLAANAGSAWRSPGVNELYNYGVHHGTAQFEIGNPALTAERSYSTDVTLRHASERVRLEVSAFNNWILDFIHLFPEPEPTVTIRGVFPTYRYTQADAVLRGLDGYVEYQPTAFLTLGLSGALVRATNLERDIPLINMPADRARFSTAFALPDLGQLRGSRLEVGGTFVARQTRVPEDVDYAPPPDGYAAFDVGYGATLHMGTTPVQLNLSVQNLLDTAYRDYLSRFRYFIDEPGRSVVLRLQVPIGSFEP